MKRKLICGIAINDSKNNVTGHLYQDGKRKKIYLCEVYKKWQNMIHRCYSKSNSSGLSRYEDVSVCDEWLRFSNFKKWIGDRDLRNLEIDKDLKVDGNRVYGPETCLLVTHEVNSFLVLSNNIRGDYPVGVCLFKRDGNYHSYIKHNGKRIHIGYFDTPEEAHKAWQSKKLDFAVEIRGYQTDPDVISGLDRVIKKLKHHIANGLETKSL